MLSSEIPDCADLIYSYVPKPSLALSIYIPLVNICLMYVESLGS